MQRPHASQPASPLCVALQAGHTELAALLLANGGTPVSKLHAQFYPVHALVMLGDLAGLREALAARPTPDLDYQDSHGLTPLNVACALGELEFVKVHATDE